MWKDAVFRWTQPGKIQTGCSSLWLHLTPLPGWTIADPQHQAASLLLASIFARCRYWARSSPYFVLICLPAPVWLLGETESLPGREGSDRQPVCYGEKALLKALGPTRMPLGGGQRALGSLLL